MTSDTMIDSSGDDFSVQRPVLVWLGAPLAGMHTDVAETFDRWVQERVGHTVFAGGCRSWYLTENGRNTQNWPASTLTFRRRLRRYIGARRRPRKRNTGPRSIGNQHRRRLDRPRRPVEIERQHN